MTPTKFEGQDTVLRKPGNMTDEECGPLPILRLQGTCISCWKMSWRERIKCFWQGYIWIGVLSGNTQPPIYVAIDKPFVITKQTTK